MSARKQAAGDIVRSNIKRIRTEKGLSLREIERRTGIAISGLSKIEAGTRHIKVDDLVTIALGLGVSAIELLPPTELAAAEQELRRIEVLHDAAAQRVLALGGVA